MKINEKEEKEQKEARKEEQYRNSKINLLNN